MTSFIWVMLFAKANGKAGAGAIQKDFIMQAKDCLDIDYIETTLRSHAAIDDCVVFEIPWIECIRFLVAGVVVRPGYFITYDEADAFLKEATNCAQAIRYLHIIDAIPVNDNGMIDQEALIDLSLLRIANAS